MQDDAESLSYSFEFDAVLGSRCGQQEAFETCGKPVLEAALAVIGECHESWKALKARGPGDTGFWLKA